VLHQENTGLSEARNQGVKVSTGEYIVFIDSDDYVSPDYIECLLSLNEKFGTDVSCAERILFWDGQQPTIPEKESIETKFSAGEALAKICYNRISICAWGKMYKRELIEKYPYPKGELYEDTATTYKLVGEAKEMSYSTKPVYFWRQRSGSITHAAINEKHYFGIIAAKEQIAYMEENYPEAVSAAKSRCMMKIVDLSYRLVLGKKDPVLFQRIRSDAKALIKDIRKDKKSGISLKFRGTALCLGYFPYLVLSKAYHFLKRNDA